MANAAIAYVLWFFGSWLGLHHLYLRRPNAAFVNVVTLNGWGVVWFKDFLSIPELVEQANGGAEYEEKLRVASKFHPKPPLSLLASLVQIFVGTQFGSIAACLLPKGVHAVAYEIMFALGAAFGIIFTGDALDEHTTGSFLWVFSSIAIVLVPGFFHYGSDYYDDDYRSTKAATVFLGVLAYLTTRRWSTEAVEISEKLEGADGQSAIQDPKKKTLPLWKTLLKYWTLLGLFLTSGITALAFHGDIQIEVNGEIVETPFFEACDNFFKSEAFQAFTSTLYDLYEGTSEDERFQDRWERFSFNMDLSGRLRSLKVLGLPKDASAKDIKTAYRRLVLQWHPDKHTGEDKELANAKFLEIQEAYEKLTGANEQETETMPSWDEL